MKALLPPDRAAAVLTLLGALVLPAFAPVHAQGALTPEQLTLRVERLTELSQRSDQKLSSAQAQLKKISDDMARMGRLIDNQAMLDMIRQVDDLSSEISQLNGAIEEQGFELESIKKRQRELYLDIDRRLRAVESGAAGRPTASQGGQSQSTISSGQSVAPSLPAAGAGAAIGSTQSTQSAARAASGQPAASQGPVSATQSEEKAAYQAAFDTLKEGRYRQAKVELKTFLDRYPNSSFAGNAQYWLGEAHYVTRDFQQGISEFRIVLDKYPGSNKRPDAMLKLGYTYYELKQFAEAKQILNDLSQRYPNSTAARLAGKRLERIRREGN